MEIKGYTIDFNGKRLFYLKHKLEKIDNKFKWRALEEYTFVKPNDGSYFIGFFAVDEIFCKCKPFFRFQLNRKLSFLNLIFTIPTFILIILIIPLLLIKMLFALSYKAFNFKDLHDRLFE